MGRISVLEPPMREEVIVPASPPQHIWIQRHWPWNGKGGWQPGYWVIPPRPMPNVLLGIGGVSQVDGSIISELPRLDFNRQAIRLTWHTLPMFSQGLLWGSKSYQIFTTLKLPSPFRLSMSSFLTNIPLMHLSKLCMGYPMVIPCLPIPTMIPIVFPPSVRNSSIKRWNTVIVTPT